MNRSRSVAAWLLVSVATWVCVLLAGDTLAAPTAAYTAAGWIMPKKYPEQVGDDGFKKHPIGLGPYKFVSHTPGVELVMEAVESYWRKAPHVKRLVFKSVPEVTTRLAMMIRV
jgi:peptide/nickel transport system substrate-binding protein